MDGIGSGLCPTVVSVLAVLKPRALLHSLRYY